MGSYREITRFVEDSVDGRRRSSESPFYIGRTVVALASNPNMSKKAGKALSTWHLTEEYGFTDMDGRRSDRGSYIAKHFSYLLK